MDSREPRRSAFRNDYRGQNTSQQDGVRPRIERFPIQSWSISAVSEVYDDVCPLRLRRARYATGSSAIRLLRDTITATTPFRNIASVLWCPRVIS